MPTRAKARTVTAPRVTVGLPVFNGERHVAATIESILAQTHRDLELLISDNASTDGTAAICRAYADEDPRVEYLRLPENLGAARNYNLLVDHARGELFKWAPHDDLCRPAFLERCVEALDRSGRRAVAAFPLTAFIDVDGAPLRDHDDAADWRDGVPPHERLRTLLGARGQSLLHRCSAVVGVIRTDVLRRTRRIGPFPKSDNALIVELALHGDLIEVPERLFLRREHAGSHLSANRAPAEVARWFDPSRGARLPLARTRLARSYLESVLRAPLTPRERLRCLGVLARWLGAGEWRVIAGELRIGLRQRLRPPSLA